MNDKDDYIGFSIKTEDTPESREAFDSFFTFAKTYTKNDYTTALRFLLEAWEQNKNLSMVYEKLTALENEVMELKKVDKEPEEDSGKEVF